MTVETASSHHVRSTCEFALHAGHEHCVGLLAKSNRARFDRIKKVDQTALCVSIITAAELRFGSARRGSARLQAVVDEFLERVTVEPFGEPSDIHHGTLRARLEAAGQSIGPNDLLIAAHALALAAVLVTGNEREFSRVRGLKVENWLSDGS